MCDGDESGIHHTEIVENMWRKRETTSRANERMERSVSMYRGSARLPVYVHILRTSHLELGRGVRTTDNEPTYIKGVCSSKYGIFTSSGRRTSNVPDTTFHAAGTACFSHDKSFMGGPRGGRKASQSLETGFIGSEMLGLRISRSRRNLCSLPD